MFLLFMLLIVALPGAFSVQCSWQKCPKWKENFINIHLVPNTHLDAGWLETFLQYYNDDVKFIIENVIKELEKDKDRRFSFAETIFLWHWWLQQNNTMKDKLWTLINNGQFEFVGGGWVQNDEAATHYVSIIDQMTLGLGKLNETFGKCGRPKVAWQLDPFGHSREQASIFAQMGFKGLFFARVHFVDRAKRIRTKATRFIWHGSDDLGSKSDILTGHFAEHYEPPKALGICFGEKGGCDDRNFKESDVPRFINWSQNITKFYKTKHIIISMCTDFAYKNAENWFNNMDKIIKFVNALQSKGSNVNALYSTPACYVKALQESHVKWPAKSDDFFPYARGSSDYWTGFFTSRPTFKRFAREMGQLLQLSTKFGTLAALEPKMFKKIEVMKEAVAICQHHDAITGTETQEVTLDYEKFLYKGLLQSQELLNEIVKKSMSELNATNMKICPLLNVSICDVTQKNNKKFTVAVFNSQTKLLKDYIRVPCSGHFEVTAPNGSVIDAQMVSVFNHKSQLGYLKSAPFEVIVPIEVPPLSFVFYKFSKDPEKQNTVNAAAETSTTKHTISNKFIELQFDVKTGLLVKYKTLSTGISTPMKQNFFFYKGEGGAYAFDTDNVTHPISTKTVKLTKIEGKFVNEMRQVFSPWASQVVRLYKDKPHAEFEWTIGPIPIPTDGLSTNIITRFDTNIKSNKIFYTDSNGRQMMKRTRNYQTTYKYENSEPKAGNYFPVNSRIAIKDSETQLTLLTDRSQGGSSLADGSAELMLHRRMLTDDNAGLGCCLLNETGPNGKGLIVRGKMWLVLSSPEKAPKIHRPLAMQIIQQPVYMFSKNLLSSAKSEFRGLRDRLPENVNLLTLEQLSENSILLRLEHYFQKFEGKQMSKTVNVNLKDLFKNFQIISAQELSLGANHEIAQNNENLNITLNAFEIRTFRCNILKRKNNP